MGTHRLVTRRPFSFKLFTDGRFQISHAVRPLSVGHVYQGTFVRHFFSWRLQDLSFVAHNTSTALDYISARVYINSSTAGEATTVSLHARRNTHSMFLDPTAGQQLRGCLRVRLHTE